MQSFDPWAGYNAGMQTLGSTLSELNTEKARRDQMQRQNQLSDLQMQQTQMTLSDLMRKRTVEEGAREAVANAQPTTATTFSQSGERQTGALSPDPSLTEITGRSTKPPNRDRILLDYYKQNDPERAISFEKVLMDKFKALSDTAPEAAIEWYNEFSGQSLKYTGKKGDYTIVHEPNSGKIVAVNTKDPTDMQIVSEGERKPLIVPQGSAVLGADNKPVFTNPKPDQDAAMEKRFAQQQELQRQREAAADKRQERQLAAISGRMSGTEERDYRKQNYQLQKEIRSDKYVNQADDSAQKLTAMKAAYAEGKSTRNYTGADQAIGYYVNKLFDPDSVVMVSEFNRVAQSQGVPDRIIGNIQALSTGGIKLTDKTRDALIRTVEEVNKIAQSRKSDRLRQYRADAISMGLDPDKILAGRDAVAKPPPGRNNTPKPGEVVKGYRFKGGNPADKNNWVKI